MERRHSTGGTAPWPWMASSTDQSTSHLKTSARTAASCKSRLTQCSIVSARASSESQPACVRRRRKCGVTTCSASRLLRGAVAFDREVEEALHEGHGERILAAARGEARAVELA